MRRGFIAVGSVGLILSGLSCFDFGDISGGATDASDATSDAANDGAVEGRDAGPCTACDESACFEGVCGGREVVSYSTGNGTSCAVVKSGSVWCWGDNSFGQLGSLAVGSGATPVEVGAIYQAIKVSVGINYVCAVTSDGSVWCWGNNAKNELGRDDITSTSPAEVAGVTGATDVSAGHNFTCAITNGGVTCWGDDLQGQLGNGVVDPSDAGGRTPVVAISPGNVVTEIGAGLNNCTGACAIENGETYCWGSNGNGALGHTPNTNGDITTGAPECAGYCNPTPHLGGPASASELSVSGHTNCAVSAADVVCWGFGAFGVLGPSSVDGLDHPVPIALGISSAAHVSSRAVHACAVASGGNVYCWGLNDYGELGRGNNSSIDGGCSGDGCQPTPAIVPSFTAISVTTGSHVTIAQATDKSLWSWGMDGAGQLGRPGESQCGSQACSFTPHPVLGLP